MTVKSYPKTVGRQETIKKLILKTPPTQRFIESNREMSSMALMLNPQYSSSEWPVNSEEIAFESPAKLLYN
ncbi:hypothetical protein TNCV_368471 [Trichonephila clavipes]|nr:hypothetical protein TNCV_368471 [Trichonephila clavipes]